MRFQPSSRERLRNLLTLFNAAKMLILGKFNPVSSSKISFPVWLNTALISSGVSEGFACWSNAAAPATWGVAWEVPVIEVEELPNVVDLIEDPGANTSKIFPLFVNELTSLSPSKTLPTEVTFGMHAG